jgi:hypothetical protein
MFLSAGDEAPNNKALKLHLKLGHMIEEGESVKGVKCFFAPSMRAPPCSAKLSKAGCKARTQIARHVDKIVLSPVEKGGKRFYVATGEWSSIGNEMGPDHEPAPVQLRMVAGARFERATFDPRPRSGRSEKVSPTSFQRSHGT